MILHPFLFILIPVIIFRFFYYSFWSIYNASSHLYSTYYVNRIPTTAPVVINVAPATTPAPSPIQNPLKPPSLAPTIGAVITEPKPNPTPFPIDFNPDDIPPNKSFGYLVENKEFLDPTKLKFGYFLS
jgi:hypothetical protein